MRLVPYSILGLVCSLVQFGGRGEVGGGGVGEEVCECVGGVVVKVRNSCQGAW